MTYQAGETLAVHPAGHRLVAYLGADRRWWTALYTGGGFVRAHPDGGWAVPDFDGRFAGRPKLSRSTLGQLARILPDDSMPPLHPDQQPLADQLADIDTPPDDDDGMVPLIDWTETHDLPDDAVEGLIIYGRWLQLVAASKGGKSSLEMWIAIELSEGRDPLDGSPVDPVRVLYGDGEMGRPDLEQLIRDLGHDPAKLANLHCTVAPVRLDTLAGAGRLLRRVDALEARIVILDGLNGFINPDASENDDNTWRRIVEYTIDPLKRRGVAIVSGDNMGKDPTRGPRGSSVKTDKADGVIQVRITDQGARLHPTHSRAGVYITADLDLAAEGFDRSRPIRYWRAAGSGWPAGTAAAVALLDELKIPVGESRRKVRARLAAAAATDSDPERLRVRNDALGAAIRQRRTIQIGNP